MTLRAFMIFVWACLIAAAAVAGPDHKTQIEIAIDGDDKDHRLIRLDGRNGDFDLRDLAVGESRVITDADGNDVSVLRTENGFELEIEGEMIEIPGMFEDHDFGFLHDSHALADGSGEIHKEVHMIKAGVGRGVTIISDEEIDDETRVNLEKVLKDAGKDGDVLFIDGSELHLDEQAHTVRQVRIIKKEIDATN